VNGDGFVDNDDYNGVIRPRRGAAIGSAGYLVEADLDRDGKVAQSDYDIAVADDGKSSSGGVGEAGLFAKGVRNGVGYCGYIFNDESGLYTVRFRSYSPALGRWLERDPAGYVDGLSLYAYVSSTPITAVDPSGLRKCFTRSINLHPKGLLCDGTDVEFEVCWSCAGGKLTVESPRMVNKPKVPCDYRFWDTVHTTVSLVLGVDALHEFSVQIVKSEAEPCKCGPGVIQTVVIEAVWTYRHAVRVGVGVTVGPLPLELDLFEISNRVQAQQRGSQKHTFYCCDNNRREAELRRGDLRK
jgi:RHS repeat-associated protein